MTDDELDLARAEEAWRLAYASPKSGTAEQAVVIAARVAREEPPDPLIVETKAISDGHCDWTRAGLERAVYEALERGIEIGRGK